MSGNYYIYENWVHSRATIHVGECFCCNHGQGRSFDDYDSSRAKWHKSIKTLNDARRLQKSLDVKERKECKFCINRTLL